MLKHRTALLIALMSVAPVSLVVAQSQDTSPSAASSPSQRAATSSSPQEAPATSSSSQTSSTGPDAASSPHQQQATGGKQAMKDCVAKQKSMDSNMSASDAKKACKAQMKGTG